MKYTAITALLLSAWFAVSGAPARPGNSRQMTQPDGSTVTLTVCGDEHHHIYITGDNRSVIGVGGGYYYATVDSDGNAVASTVLAHDAAYRACEEVQFLNSLEESAVRLAVTKAAPQSMRATHSGVGTNAPDYPTTGKRKGLVFLVQYADVTMTLDDPYDYFYRMLNEEGFSSSNGTGSCRDYFICSSNGLYEPDFDVYGPVTLPENREYYGGNDSNGNDKNAHYMMLHAAQALDEDVDFSQYDLDGDGYVDYVFIFYAGEGESGGGGEDTVWPHSWEYRFNQKFDGVRFKRYACGCEMMSRTLPDGVGTFCHEFGHVLGLPDLYNTADPYASYTPNTWSAMDQGCYNNNGHTPPSFSAFERNALGWMGDLMFEPEAAGEYSLKSLIQGNEAMLIPTDDEKEFFIFENRQKEGWDKYLPGHGMLVWHIDYDYSSWYYNSPNGDANHQRIDIVEACNKSSLSMLKSYPFPGKGAVGEFRYGGEPSFETWAGNDLGYELTDIRETNGLISFILGGDAAITDVTCDAEAALVLIGRTLHVDAEHAMVSDISGRVIASGAHLSAELPSAGIYIISADGKTKKIAVK